MTVGSRRARGTRDSSSESLLGSFAELSLDFAQAQTEPELRILLDRAALFLGDHSAVPVAICELGLSTSGGPRLISHSRSSDLSIEADENFQDWYLRANRRGGEATALQNGHLSGLLSAKSLSADGGLQIAIFFQADRLAPETLTAGYGLADTAAVASMRIRSSLASALERRRLQRLFEEAQSWLGLDADLLWEAGEDGIIRVRRLMNGRKDIGPLVDGLKLSSIETGKNQTLLEALRDRETIRCRQAQIVSLPSGKNGLVVSAQKYETPEGIAYIGSFAAAENGDGREYTREAAAMMVQMRGARAREEQQRREAEAMLQGLRLLLAPDSTREKLAQLVSLVCQCVGAETACVVQRGLDGGVRFLIPRDGKPGRGAEKALDLVENEDDGETALAFDVESDDGRLLANAFGVEGRHLGVLPLPLRGDTAFLICAAERSGGFDGADLAFADRLTLLLRQALLLREEQTQLAQTAKMAALGQMSASIAHELRQPLNTISLAVQNLEILLEAPKVDNAAVAAKTKRVLTQVERASEVIDRMRRFGRKSTGEQANVNLREVVENVETIMHHVLLRAGVRLEAEVPEGLIVVGDQLQYEQVLGNLIQNAVDAISGIGARHEREDGWVRVRAQESPDEKGMVILRVEDNGPGFRQEILERVLEPFFTTKTAEHGTGLGLAICDTIIREGGGRITLGNHESGGYVALILPQGAPD